MKIIGVTVVSIGDLLLCLPPPNKLNTGGYKNHITGEYDYSPVDIAVAGLAEEKETIKDLSTWFIKNENPLSKIIVRIIIYTNGIITSHSILEWEHIVECTNENSELIHLLKRNAPFTFRRL